MFVNDMFLGVLTGGFSRWLSALDVGKSAPTYGKFGDGECVNALRVMHIRIRKYALKYQLHGSSPKPWTA